MGFLFAATRRTNDVQLHANGREKAAALLPPLPKRIHGGAPERRFLFDAMQEPVQRLQGQGEEKGDGIGAKCALRRAKTTFEGVGKGFILPCLFSGFVA
jgi:hypothetical protein